MLVCPICGEETNYLDSHLGRWKHNLSVEERKEVWKRVKIDRSNRVTGITDKIFRV